MSKISSESYGILDDRYIYLELEMGKGKTSKVYKAKDFFSEKNYAVKIFEEYSQEFENEVLINKKILNSKKNTNFFIKYISSSLNGTFYIDGSKVKACYILYELATKGDLCNYLINNQNGFNEKNCKIMCYKILKALQALHELGICHRDIKSDNILLDGERFDVKIGDFGVSSFFFVENKKKLQKGKYGTYLYMAKEVYKKYKYDGELADIYSTGILFFTLLTGKFPFPSAIKDGIIINPYYKFIEDKDYETYWEKLKVDYSIDGLSSDFKDLFLQMVDSEPSERPIISKILNHNWMKEITNLNEEEFKKYEENLISELKEREENLKKPKNIV